MAAPDSCGPSKHRIPLVGHALVGDGWIDHVQGVTR